MASPQETKLRYEQKLGTEFGAVFYGLYSNWASARVRYKEFRILFNSRENVELLNGVGGYFFGDIQEVLWDNLMLHVCRLTDPIKSSGKKNLTINWLPKYCEEDYPDHHGSIEKLTECASETTKFARDWRNRRISHTDLSWSIDSNPNPLADASLLKLEKSLNYIHAALNFVSMYVMNNGEIANDVSYQPKAQALVAYVGQLADAVRFIDSIVDPSSKTDFKDLDVTREFLSRLGYQSSIEHIDQVINLREAASRFK